MRFIGRAVELCYQVANTGMAVADNVEAEAIIPEGGRVRGLTEGGEVRGNRVVWRLGDLVPGTNQNVCARMTFDRAAVFRLAGRVATDCLENVGAFRGGIEVIDIEDPIEVGATDTDEIAVTNEGTAMDTNIRIECLASLAPNQTGRWRVVVRAVSREDVRFKVSLKTDQFSRPVEETEATNQY